MNCENGTTLEERYKNFQFEKHYNEGLLIQDEYSYKTFFTVNERNTNILEMT